MLVIILPPNNLSQCESIKCYLLDMCFGYWECHLWWFYESLRSVHISMDLDIVKLLEATVCQQAFSSGSRALRTCSSLWPKSQKTLWSHMFFFLFSSSGPSAFILVSPWIEREKGHLFFIFLMSHSAGQKQWRSVEGGQKADCALQPSSSYVMLHETTLAHRTHIIVIGHVAFDGSVDMFMFMVLCAKYNMEIGNCKSRIWILRSHVRSRSC